MNAAKCLHRNKWFILACLFLIINAIGLMSLRQDVPAKPVSDTVQRLAIQTASNPPPASPRPRTTKHAAASQKRLTLSSLKTESPAHTDPFITAIFSTPVDLESLRHSISIEPNIDVTVEKRYSWRSSREYRMAGAFVPGQAYSLTLQKTVKARDSEARLEHDITRRILLPDRKPAVRFRSEGHYLSPAGSLLVPLTCVNVEKVDVTVHRIFANNLVQYAMREGDHYQRYYGESADAISTPVTSKTYAVSGDRNSSIDRSIPLIELLGTTPEGAYVLRAKAEKAGTAERFLVITDTGIAVKRSPNELLVWANSIRTLDALSHAQVRVYSEANQLLCEGPTDEQGLALLSLPDETDKPFLVSVQKGNDLSFLSLDNTAVNTHGTKGERPCLTEGCEAFLFSDRGVYRPGETSHVVAIVRDSTASCPTPFPVELQIVRPDGRLHSREHAMLSKLATTEFELPWESYDETGQYNLKLCIPGTDRVLGSVRIAVEDFVPPRLGTTLTLEQPSLSSGKQQTVSVTGRYLYGGKAAGNPVSCRIEVTPSEFEPKGWSSYSFRDTEKGFTPFRKQLGGGRLDDQGQCSFKFVPPQNWKPPSSLRALFSAGIMEQGGRIITGYAGCDVHPYPFYIGVRRLGQQQNRPGESIDLEAVLVNPHEEPRREARTLQFLVDRVSWTSALKKDRHGRYHYESTRHLARESETSVMTDKSGRLRHTFRPGGSGSYIVRLVDAGAGVSASLDLYIGNPHSPWQSRSLEQPDCLDLTLDKETYSLGETARLTVKAPYSGKALLTADRDRLLVKEVKVMAGNTVEFLVPITPNLRPNAHLTVSVIREVQPGGHHAGSRAVGSIPIKLDDSDIRLSVEVTAPKEIRPLTSLEVQLSVEGGGDEMEMVLAAVDEGICMLTDFETPDPAAFFAALRNNEVEHFDLYALLMPETDNVLAPRLSHVAGGMGRQLKSRLNPITSRRFNPIALWRSGIIADSNGMARVQLDIPEFTGALRLMAVAVDKGRFGHAESTVLVKRPFTVLSSLPRFLAPGDESQMSVELRNNTEAPGEATLRITCDGPIALRKDGSSKNGTDIAMNVSLAQGEQKHMRFPIYGQSTPGLASVKLEAHLRNESCIERTELSVRPAAPRQTVSGTAKIPADQNVVVSLPDEWLHGTQHYELNLAGLPTIKLAGSLEYLIRYPYGCLEQTTSSSFPLLYLADLANCPGSHLYIGDTSEYIAAGIDRILSMQLPSGAFAYWPHSTKIYRWGSIYATHFLVEAHKAAHDIPTDCLDHALRYLETLLQAPSKSSVDLDSDTWREEASLRAYACHVLSRAGKPQPGWVFRLREQAEFLGYDARLHLAMAQAASGHRRRGRDDLQDLGSPQEALRLNGGSLASPVRSMALLLLTWLEFDSEHPDIPSLVTRLESSMKLGRWYTTQENAVALMALGKYMHMEGTQEQPWSGTVRQGKRQWAVDSSKKHQAIQLTETGHVTISNNGPSPIYCSWLANGVPHSAITEEVEAGISVKRQFLDLNACPIINSTFVQGELRIVELVIDTAGRSLDNVVIEDLLPAGLEIENTSLKTSQLVPWAKKRSTLPVRHVELRDDRIIIFPEKFSGTRKYCYAVRAVTPGFYDYPPVQASCMYDPLTRCIHGTGEVTVEVPSE